MSKFYRVVPAVSLLLLVGLLSGCGLLANRAGGKVNYTNNDYGCSFSLPGGWKIEETKERQGILTLQVQDKGRESSYLVITVFPAERFTPAETLDEAERLLEKGLYVLQEPVERDELTLPSGDIIPLLGATAGRKETVEAATAVIYGSGFNALVTLIAREEHFASYQAEYLALLDSFQLE